MEFFPLSEPVPIYAASAAFARMFSILSVLLVFLNTKYFYFSQILAHYDRKSTSSGSGHLIYTQ